MRLKRHIMQYAITACVIIAGCSARDTVPPEVIKTFPKNGAQDVDPFLTEITATFNEEMLDKSWAWCMENKETFPEMTGDPYYMDDSVTNVLPVRLEGNKEYVIWLNMGKFTAFKDKSGLSLKPYRFTFKTR